MPRFLGILCTLALGATAVSCGTSSGTIADTPTAPAGPLLETELRYEGGTLRVELARTPEERGRGLGGRDSLAPDGGMLFVFDTTHTPWFWMKDMRFPLDFVWIGEDKQIVEITPDVPHEPGIADAQLRHYMSSQPVRYVLEVNTGTAARLGLEVGDQLAFDLPQ